jgi:AAA+ superfamily predicted ATPase
MRPIVLVPLITLALCLFVGLIAALAGEPAAALIIPAFLLIGLAVTSCCYSTGYVLRNFLRISAFYRVYHNQLPVHRYVDWYRALEVYAAGAKSARRWDASHRLDLYSILRSGDMRVRSRPAEKKVCIGYDRFAFIPDEVFWLLIGPPGLGERDRIVLRVRWIEMPGYPHPFCMVEVASNDPDKAQIVLDLLEKQAGLSSVFRGQFVEVRWRATMDYQYMAPSAEMQVAFLAKPNITEEDIILAEQMRTTLRRNIFDHFVHRERLQELGLPRKRALLFYGPPGTGKTHTCRHVHTQLKDVTTILASGDALLRLKDISKFARQLQPALVIAEDVDLVFTKRDVNPYGATLGDFMDELDGFAPDDEIIMLLTTNAIERVEEAIRDRPGRINQCLFFGLPTPELRRRYLTQNLNGYNLEGVDMHHLVRQTEGTSQAFLKEYVFRAVQVAAESVGYTNSVPLLLKTEHFDAAFEELTSHGDPHSRAIMGFHVRSSAP